MRRISILTAAAITLSLVACGGSVPLASSAVAVAALQRADQADEAAGTALIQRTLADALEAAKSYGRTTLGHYRKLSHRSLAAQGFRPAADVRLRVYVSHTNYCLAATHTGLPASSPWRVASIDSRRQQPAPGDRCATLLGSTGIATTASGAMPGRNGGWICRLPTAGG
jgi:hypothetical protein